MSVAAVTNRVTYKALPLAGLMADSVPPVNLYLPAHPPAKARLYRSFDLPIRTSDINELRTNGVSELWFDRNDYALIKRFIEDNLGTLLSDESKTPTERMRLLNQVVIDNLAETFSSNDTTKPVVATRQLAVHVVDLGVGSEITIREVARIANHDFSTFTHSANVANYATLLAKSIGISDTNELRDIAAAAMLHDIGKLRVPKKILNKPGRLTNEEMAIVRLHPIHGFQQLRNRKELSRGQLLMVYQHHEWMNGKGYPVGCIGNELHLWSRICAVADVFEALTGKRPYRRPNTIDESLVIMERDIGTQFDADLFRCWRNQFSKTAK